MQESAILKIMHEHSHIAATTDKMHGINLHDLMVEIKEKDRCAFEKLYDATVDRVYSLAIRITHQHEIAEEVVSDVYLQIWRQAEHYDETRGNVIAWLTVLCRSRSLDALRHHKALTGAELVNSNDKYEFEETNQPQDLLIAIEQQSALYAVLEKLSDQQRQLLALAYFRGYSHRELSDFTGLPIGTVKSQIRRALLALKSMMPGVESKLGVVK